MSQSTNLELFKLNKFSVEIFGLGYVGFPLAIRLAKSGLKVKGIDINPQRLERLLSNDLYESELNLKEEFLRSKKNGNLEILKSPIKTDFPKVGIICVPTPVTKKRKIPNINFISANGGQVFESELRKKFLQPRTTMWRAVKRLERHGIIEIVKKDFQNVIKLRSTLEDDS